MKIPAIATNAEHDPPTYWPRLVMPQYRTMQGVKKPAIGTNQCRSNNGYKGGVLSPAFWKVTLNSVPSFYSDIASLCQATVHEITFDGEVDAWPVYNKTEVIESVTYPAHWRQVYVDDGPPPVLYSPYEDGQYGEMMRAIYANYTPYKPQPNRPAVPQAIAGERNPDYVTATSYGDAVALAVISAGTGHAPGDVITFSGGTALYADGLTVLTNTGFQLQHEYTQTGGHGSGMKVLAYSTTKFSDVKLWDNNHIYEEFHADVCGKGHAIGNVLTFSGGTAQVTATGIQTIWQTAGTLVPSVTSLNVLTDTGFLDGHTYDQTGTTGTGEGGRVLATISGFSHFDIVNGGTGYAVGDHIFLYQEGYLRYGSFDVASVDGNGTITAITGTGYCGAYPSYNLPYEQNYDQPDSTGRNVAVLADWSGLSPGTGCQVYCRPSYALTPQTTINIISYAIDVWSCGVNHQVGDILTFNGSATAEVLSISTPNQNYPELDGQVTSLKLTDTTGLEPFTNYMQTGTTGSGTGAGIFTDALCTVDRAGWPRYNVGVRSMKWDTYGQAQVTPGKLQIAVGLHIPRFSDRYRPAGVWYPDGDVYVAWGVELDAEMWPDVMKLDSLTLPFVGVSRTWYGTYGTGNYGHDGAADWSGTTITLTRTQKPTDNYPGRPYPYCQPVPPWKRP